LEESTQVSGVTVDEQLQTDIFGVIDKYQHIKEFDSNSFQKVFWNSRYVYALQ
jgi:hypothetical protein